MEEELRRKEKEVEDLKQQLRMEQSKNIQNGEGSESNPLLEKSDENNEVDGVEENPNFLQRSYNRWKKVRFFILPILNIASFVIMIIVNILSSTTKLIGGYRSDEVSNNNPTFFTPAGYAFSIWSLIYTTVGIFCLVQLPLLFLRKDNILIFEKVGFFFILSCICNFFWLFLWGASLLLASAVQMSLLLTVLVIIYFRVNIDYTKASRDKRSGFISWVEFFVVQIPFSLYLGWITAAFLANLAIAGLKSPLGINERVWSITMLTFTTIPTLLLLIFRRDVFYASAVLWAVIAIGVKQQAEDIILSAAMVITGILSVSILIAISYEVITFATEKINILRNRYT